MDTRRAALKICDAERAEDLLRNARDKRLTYRRIGEAGHAQVKGAKASQKAQNSRYLNHVSDSQPQAS